MTFIKLYRRWRMRIYFVLGTIWMLSGCDPFSCKSAPTQPGPGSGSDAFAVNHIAQWDSSKWKSLGNGVSSVENGFASVNALDYDSGRLYVGGTFDFADAKEFNSIAFWDGEQWRGFGTAAAPGVTKDIFLTPGDVYGLDADGSGLYVGGDFNTVHNPVGNGLDYEPLYADNIAYFSLATSLWDTLGNGTNGTVRAIRIDNNSVYVGGEFTATDEVAGTRGIARWNSFSREWESLGGGVNGEGSVRDILVDGGMVYIGGDFSNVGSNPAAYNIAMWNGETWVSLGNGPNGIVNKIAKIGTEIYVAGQFFQETGFYLFAKWNGEGWSYLGDSYPHGGGFYQNIGHAVRSYNSMIATGGHFPVMGEVALNNVAVVNNSVFQELSGGAYNEMQEEFPAFVYALAANGGNLFVGGNFTIVGKAE